MQGLKLKITLLQKSFVHCGSLLIHLLSFPFTLKLFIWLFFFILLKEYVNEMESVESSLKQMGENVNSVQGTAMPGLVSWGQDKLDKCQDRWETLSKKV